MEEYSKLRGNNTELTILLVFILLDIFWRLQSDLFFETVLYEYQNILYEWVLRMIYFVIIGWFGVRKFLRKPIDSAIIGIYRGAVLGVIIGLFELVWYHNVNAFVFLLALPWQMMLLGFIITGLTAYILNIWGQEKKDYLQSN